MAVGIEDLSPREIVKALDKYVIGQDRAKRAVAIALRNRNRRKKVPAELRDEISPKNIIMMGPTGVGKTEIARRLAKLDRAPFIKVEATKFTEVGYVGRDVESIVRDLLNVAIGQEKKDMQKKVHDEAVRRTEEKLLDFLLPQGEGDSSSGNEESTGSGKDVLGSSYERTRQKMLERLRLGALDDKLIDIKVPQAAMGKGVIDIPGDFGMEQIDMMMQHVFRQFKHGAGKKKTLKVRDARKILMQESLERLIDSDEAIHRATVRTEESGIVFLDEIDKIVTQGSSRNVDVSRQGVQRDLLPLIEGSTVNTRYGVVKTDHILFIAAGAFHMSSPSDMIPEMQGRFPIRVELESLSSLDLKRILIEPKNALIKQYKALLATEGVTLDFDEKALETLAEFADKVNCGSINIGARRLITLMEKLLEDILYTSPNLPKKKVKITSAYVVKHLKPLTEDKDVTRYIL